MDKLFDTAVLVAIFGGVFAVVTELVKLLLPERFRNASKVEEIWRTADKNFVDRQERYLVSIHNDIDKYKKELEKYREKVIEQDRTIIDLERRLAHVQTQMDMIKTHLETLKIKIPSLTVVR